MGCLFVVLAVLLPRIALIFIYLGTNWFSYAFSTAVWPLLGFFFMPYTTLAYTIAMVNTGGTLTGLWIILIIIAVLADLGHWGHAGRYGRRRFLPG